MTNATAAAPGARRDWNALHLLALLGGNAALAVGPLWVRLTDAGPVSAGFWRLALAVPLLALLARVNRQPLGGLSVRTLLALGAAGVFFALDLASWHVGIGMTRLGNASLFGNSGSLIVMVWGLFVLHRRPYSAELLAVVLTIGGAAILMGRSLEINRATMVGDLFCVLAGLLYTFYIVVLHRARVAMGSWTLLFWSTLAGLPVLLGTALLLGEPVLPSAWWVVIALALTSQVIGQGLLVYAFAHFTPLVIGLALMTQPVVSVAIGWAVFGEALTPLDGLGMALVAIGLVLARGTQSEPDKDLPVQE